MIPANYEHLAIDELDRRTTLRTADAAVHTIEHVLSALTAAAVDDAVIKVDAAEPPFADGSALPYTQLIRQVGITPHNEMVKPIVIHRPLAFRFRNAEICAIPSAEYRVSFYFTSNHPNLRSQAHSFHVTPEAYATDIAPARTFCFFEEIEQLRSAGLIKGANLASAVVIGRKGIINDTVRFPDEPVRHKILDFIGDMALLGSPLQGHFMAWRAGHRVNAEFGMYLKKELNL
jgi:UDP-3-O-acyl N-acetylglucosamine deacetylase